MKKLFYLLIPFIIYSCSPSNISTKENDESDEWLKKDIKHNYEVTVFDFDGNRIHNANVDVTFKTLGFKVGGTTIVTSNSGTAFFKAPTVPDLWKTKSSYSGRDLIIGYNYISDIECRISKDGYYSDYKSEKNKSAYAIDSKEYIGQDNYMIIGKLIKPTDYLSDDFMNISQYAELKTKVLSFTNYILLQGILSDANLSTKSIRTTNFKDNLYLSLQFNSTNVFNSLKFNKYDVGKKLFDDVIRKILNPLNDNLSLEEGLYGYDLILNGYIKNFANEDENNTKVEYRFYIPKDVVKKYKDKDISGQQLLDSAIILMDDERVDFKLQ
jgi:hypothetical protein